MDIIYLQDLRIEAVIGVYPWERCVKQIISLDLEMATDIQRAAASDQLDDTLDYKAVAKRLIDFVGHSEFQLVETLAERIAGLVIAEFGVPWLRLRLNKPGAISAAAGVGILIERRREDAAGEAALAPR